MLCVLMVITAQGAESPAVSFSRDVKPILARRCFACHGPDSGEGGLRLHEREVALAELKVARVTHVLVHTQDFSRRYGGQALAAVDTVPELQFETEEDGIRVYRLK